MENQIFILFTCPYKYYTITLVLYIGTWKRSATFNVKISISNSIFILNQVFFTLTFMQNEI